MNLNLHFHIMQTVHNGGSEATICRWQSQRKTVDLTSKHSYAFLGLFYSTLNAHYTSKEGRVLRR